MRGGLGAAARRAARLAASSARGLAAESGALAETTAFTRFTSPVPAVFSHAGILATPPTKARSARVTQRCRRARERGRWACTAGIGVATACARLLTLFRPQRTHTR